MRINKLKNVLNLSSLRMKRVYANSGSIRFSLMNRASRKGNETLLNPVSSIFWNLFYKVFFVKNYQEF